MRYEINMEAGKENLKFDWLIPDEAEVAKMKTMLVVITGIEDVPAQKRMNLKNEYASMVLNQWLIDAVVYS